MFVLAMLDPGSPSSVTLGPSTAGSLMDETLVSTSMVCFCDIPVADFGGHMKKFSRFGIAFLKEHLVKQYGATPVFYVAENAKDGPQNKPLGKAFDRISDELKELQKLQMGIGRDPPEMDPQLSELLRLTLSDLATHILSFVKPFTFEDHKCGEWGAYSEREWRTRTNVRFNLGDVARIILPQEFAQRFRETFPKYYGQLEFAEPLMTTAQGST